MKKLLKTQASLISILLVLLILLLPKPVNAASITVVTDADGSQPQVSDVATQLDVFINEDGSVHFRCKDAQWLNLAGEPQIPWKVMTVLLPPDVEPSTVSASMKSIQYEYIVGKWEVSPTAPMVTWVDGQKVEGWPENKTIINGYDMDIYESDAFWPQASARLLCTGQLRKFQLAQVAIPLVRYNPVTGELLKLESTGVEIDFGRKVMTQAMSISAGRPDEIGRKRVKKSAVNYKQASGAYESMADVGMEYLDMQLMDSGQTRGPDPGDPNGYTIITPASIDANSTKLDDFVTHKESLGFDVQIITESDWGGGTGDTAAENIRDWLKNNYQSDNIGYVMFIGSPDPCDSGVPMKMLWPREGEASNDHAPSDYYYADLTGDWDLDNDANYGEWDEDFGTGGVDRFYEVIVGRIPYYDYGSLTDLDTILERIIAYESDLGQDEEWRRNILIPCDPLDASHPGWRKGEQIKWSIAEAENWSSHRLYDENYGVDPAPETTPCTVANTRDVWNGSAANSDGKFGLVVWSTHGTHTSATHVMDTSNTSQLDPNYPSFVFSGSCQNSWPEDPCNLSFTLLKDAAICTLGATRNSWGTCSGQNYNEQNTGNIAYEYSERLVRDRMDCGESLHDLKQDYAPPDSYSWMNFLDYNVYGDPSLHIIRADPNVHTAVTYYVDVTDGSGDGNGLSWGTAFDDLQDALSVALENDEIWVAQGTYNPTGTSDRDISFRPPYGVSIYGGFPTGGDTFENRDPDTYETILSGDLNGNDSGDPRHASRSENSYHVVVGTSNFTLDGFTISGGNADGTPDAHLEQGGGIVLSHSSATIQDCKITDNYALYGAAWFNKNYSWPTFTDCDFTSNLVENDGGVMYSIQANATMTGCSFTSNSTYQSNGEGGALEIGYGTWTLTNCTFTSNVANRWGGAINCQNGTVTLTGCTLSDNSSMVGGAIRAYETTLTLSDCKVSDNSVAGPGTYDGIGAGIGISSDSSLQADNCIFNGNHASKYGGGIFVSSAVDADITNCTIVDNIADTSSGYGYGDGIYMESSTTTVDVTNCIVYDNKNNQISRRAGTLTVTYSCVEGGHAGTGNISTDPLFANAAADPNDYHLKSVYGRWNPSTEAWVTDAVTSPCIDTGDPCSPVGDEPANNGSRINMGTYGGTSEASKGGVSVPTVVNSAATNVASDSARLNGEVTYTGGEDPNVIIYWGDNDGVTTPENWDNTEHLGPQNSTFYKDISSLDPGTQYFFRCYATNSAGSDWADSTENFTTTSPDTLLEDDFEDDLSKWSTNWDLVTTQYVSYNHSVECSSDDDDLISGDLNTSSYSSVTITFKYRIDEIDDNDNIKVQYYDGKKYDDIEEIGDDAQDTWLTYSDTINNSGGEAQYFISDFRLKIEGSSVDTDEYLWVDDVEIIAE